MLTYSVINENYAIEHKEQTNEAIVKAYNKVDELMNTLTDDEADELIEAMSACVWNDKDTTEAKELIEGYGLTLKEAEIWYCHDAD